MWKETLIYIDVTSTIGWRPQVEKQGLKKQKTEQIYAYNITSRVMTMCGTMKGDSIKALQVAWIDDI